MSQLAVSPLGAPGSSDDPGSASEPSLRTRLDSKAICVPSGDHTGDSLSPLLEVTCRKLPPLMSMIQMCHKPLLRLAHKAISDPSRDHDGYSSPLGSLGNVRMLLTTTLAGSLKSTSITTISVLPPPASVVYATCLPSGDQVG